MELNVFVDFLQTTEFFIPFFLQYGLPMPITLLRADNNLPPWRPELKEVNT